MADNDAQLELKKRARRRLIGAVALVLAAAVFLPMVMDSEPHSGGNDLQIRIPSQEGSNYTSRLITAAPTPSAPIAAPVAIVPPTDPEMAPERSSASVGAKSASAAPVLASAPVAASSPAAQSSSVAKVTNTAKSSGSAESRAKALLEGEKADAAPHFFVQLGAYRDPENVKSVLAQLKRAGMTASTDKVGDKTRVRVGPFKTRQSADAAAARLKQGGLNGIVAAVK